jgi:hypothetical protein
VTLRRVLGDDVRRVHEQIDDLLDREDGLIVFFDRGRMVSYAPGFGLSGCQIALLTVEIERAVRDVVGAEPTINKRKKRRNSEADNKGKDRGTDTARREHCRRHDRRQHSGVVAGRPESLQFGDSAASNSRITTGRVLRLAGTFAPSNRA